MGLPTWLIGLLLATSMTTLLITSEARRGPDELSRDDIDGTIVMRRKVLQEQPQQQTLPGDEKKEYNVTVDQQTDQWKQQNTSKEELPVRKEEKRSETKLEEKVDEKEITETNGTRKEEENKSEPYSGTKTEFTRWEQPAVNTSVTKVDDMGKKTEVKLEEKKLEPEIGKEEETKWEGNVTKWDSQKKEPWEEKKQENNSTKKYVTEEKKEETNWNDKESNSNETKDFPQTKDSKEKTQDIQMEERTEAEKLVVKPEIMEAINKTLEEKKDVEKEKEKEKVKYRVDLSDDVSIREDQLLTEALVLEEEEKKVKEDGDLTKRTNQELLSNTTTNKVTSNITTVPPLPQPDREKTEEVRKSEEEKVVVTNPYPTVLDEKQQPDKLYNEEEQKPVDDDDDDDNDEKTTDPMREYKVRPDSESEYHSREEDTTEFKETKLEMKEEEQFVQDAIDSTDSDDDFPDFFDEFLRLPERLQESAEHFKTNIPGWERFSTNGKVLFNQANEQIKESFTPLVGREYAPVVAYLVSYGLFLLPLGIVMFLFERVRAIFSLQKVLLFVNIYAAAYFAALVAAAFILESEPMDFFRKFSPKSYIFLQLIQALGYIIFILLQTFDLITTCSSGRIAAKISATVQWLVVVAVGFHYYVTVFHRAMAKSKPLTSWKVYGLYSASFTILCAFARIERGKKQYIQEGGQGSTKQN